VRSQLNARTLDRCVPFLHPPVHVLKILEDAIFDVGYWRWWAIAEPSVVQIEFGGVQIARPAVDGEPPAPIGIMALRFRGATSFCFLTRDRAVALPPDWPTKLAEGKLESEDVSTAMSYELLALTDRKIAAAVLAVPHTAKAMLGAVPTLDDWDRAAVHLAFWAGQVGAIVLAESMEILTMDGSMSVDEIPALKDAWWKYWRIYWDRRRTEDALPYDGSCEVTIPLKAE